MPDGILRFAVVSCFQMLKKCGSCGGVGESDLHSACPWCGGSWSEPKGGHPIRPPFRDGPERRESPWFYRVILVLAAFPLLGMLWIAFSEDREFRAVMAIPTFGITFVVLFLPLIREIGSSRDSTAGTKAILGFLALAAALTGAFFLVGVACGLGGLT